MRGREVSREEFMEFINSYPKKLTQNTIAFCTPPLVCFDDFSDGKKQPESIVAKIVWNTHMEGCSSYNGEPDQYFLN